MDTVLRNNDVEAEDMATAEQIKAVIDAAREMRKRELKVEKLEADLKEAKKDLAAYVEGVVPKAMEAAHSEEMPLGPAGWFVKLNNIVKASIPSPHSDKVENPVEKNERGTAYLDEVAPDLVKNKLTAYFPKGMEKLFRKFLRDMAQRKVQIEFEIERTVHSGTLTKWVKDQDKLGKPVDEEALGVRRFKHAEVIVPATKSKDKLK